MSDNDKMLQYLFAENKININRGPIFDAPPGPMPKDFDFGRVKGMMLGLAIGDSLGITTEGKVPSQRKEKYGEIRDYIPNRYVNAPIGFPSDDTQLAFWTLEQMITDNGFNPENLANCFSDGRKIFGMGSTVRRFLYNYKSGKHWHDSGPDSAGNGAIMRIAPMVIPHLSSGTSDLWTDTALCAMMTHNDSSSIAACVSFVNMLWNLLKMDKSPEPVWWINTYADVAKDLELVKKYKPRGGDFSEFEGTAWEFVDKKVRDAYEKDLDVLEACNSWYSGAYMLETIPSVIYILMKHGNDPEETIIRAINDTKDNDTIAAIVGAAVGALHGIEKLPERWLSNLSGRTSYDDDGKIFELLKEAEKVF